MNEHGHKEAPTEGHVDGVGRSVFEKAAEQRSKGRKPLELAVPIYDGLVWVRYGRVSGKALGKAIKGRRSGGGSVQLNADLLVAACEAILAPHPESGELVHAYETAVGGDGNPAPVKFDGRLCQLLKLDADSPRAIAIALYGDSLPIGRHAERIINRQTGDDGFEEIDEEELDDLLGEETAAT